MSTHALLFLLILVTMPNLGELIFDLPNPLKNEVRKLEKTSIKHTKIQLSCVYNDICLQENILPKYTNIYIYIYIYIVSNINIWLEVRAAKEVMRQNFQSS